MQRVSADNRRKEAVSRMQVLQGSIERGGEKRKVKRYQLEESRGRLRGPTRGEHSAGQDTHDAELNCSALSDRSLTCQRPST
jgi:hypothetical protein